MKLRYVFLVFSLFLAVLSGCDSDGLVTYDQYLLVKKGMTLQEVEGIVGKKGTPDKESNGVKPYVWTNSNQSFLLVSFKNGKAVYITQSALP